MNERRASVRVLSFLLALCMVLSMVPMQVFADDGYTTVEGAFSSTTEYIFVATDRHTNTSILATMINAMESNIGEDKLNYLALGGDMVGSGGSHPAYNSSTVLSEITGATSSLNASNVDIVAGIHDMNVTDDAGIVLPYSGGGAQIYEGENYYVYGVPESCISGAVSGVDPETEANDFVKWATNTDGDDKDIDTSKVIIVVSHYPLHVRRNDNDGAVYWAAALNTVATGGDTTIDRNVAFFWGHNHTSESSKDTAVYHVAPGGSISVQGGSSSQTIYFTYANAGYLNSHSSATLITITGTAVTFDKYNNTSVSTSHTVTRVGAAEVPETLYVTGKDTYTVGNTIEAPAKVEVAYAGADSNTEITSGYSLSKVLDADGNEVTLNDNKFEAAGEYTLVYTCTIDGYTATAELPVTVSEVVKTLTSIAITGSEEYTIGGNFDWVVTATYSDGSTADVTDKVDFDNDFTASGAYTVTATYTEGDVTATDTKAIMIYLYDEVLAANGESVVISVEAYSQGATGLTVTWDDAADDILSKSDIYTDYVVYDLALTNPGTTAEYAMSLVANMDTTNLAVYHVADDGTLTLVEHTIENDCIVFETSLTGAFAYGNITVPEGYTLTTVTLENIPTDLFVGGSLDISDAVITATYTKEGAEDFVRQLTVYDYDENNFSGFDVDVAGAYTAVFTFEGVTAELPINVWGDEFTANGVTVALDQSGEEYGVENVTVSTVTTDLVATAVDGLLQPGFEAYDISLTYASGYKATTDTKTVTLPVPAGVTNPAVYYVSSSGQAVPMTVTGKTDTTVAFETTHFSTYVVGEGIEIDVPDAETATGSGTTTTTDKKTVYVLVSTPTAGNQYIIVNRNTAGSGYALKENTTTGTSITINASTASITAPYIETSDTTIMWNATSGLNFQSENGGYYLNYRVSKGSYSISFSTSSAEDWTADTNALYREGKSNNYYLRYNNGWTMGGKNETYNVYFYEKQTVEVETTTTVSGTYSIAGNPAEINTPVAPDGTWNLGSTLTFTPNSGAATTEDTSTKATYTVVEGGDPLGVISGINGNTVTFSGKTGKALVKVSYTTDFGVVTNYITINATAPTYSLVIMQTTTDVNGNPFTSSAPANTTIKMGTELNLSQTTGTYVDGNGNTQAVPNAKVTWSVTAGDANLITLTEDGKVTAGSTAGEVTVTATWTDPSGVEHTNYITINIVDAVYALDLVAPVYTEATVTESTFVQNKYYYKTLVYDKVVVSAETFANGTFYTKNADGTYTQATAYDASAEYYIQAEAFTIAESYVDGTTYYTQSTYVQATVTASTFVANTYYYINDEGKYQLATSYVDGTTYYTPNSITKPIIIKDVVAGQDYNNVWALIYADGVDIGKLSDAQLENLTYISSNENIATVDAKTGHISFTGNSGTVTITAVYQYAEGKQVLDTVVFSVSDEHYYIPDDGTDDFPEYPNEGSVRFDKTATAVGNFSQTGIVEVELSMTGVPYGTSVKTDVVIMVDMTSSMSDNDVKAAELAVKELIQSVVYDSTTGEYDSNIQLFVSTFGSGATDSDVTITDVMSGTTISNATELSNALALIDFIQSSQGSGGGGTRYNVAMADVYATLNRDGHAANQFVVFVSDGVATAYSPLTDGEKGTTITGKNSETESLAAGWFDDTGAVTASFKTEYYSYLIKSAGIPIYTVGANLTLLSDASDVLNHMSSNYSPDGKTASNKTGYHFVCTTSNGIDDDTLEIFRGIGQSIKEAAVDVKVEDKMGEDFIMVFDAPNSTVADLTAGQDFYIEITDYTLVPVTDANGNITDYNRGTGTSLMMLYLGKDGTTYYAATAANSTNGSNKYDTPVFDTTKLGNMLYWTTDSTKGDSSIQVTGADNKTYYFVSDGTGTHNMISGAYAFGNLTTEKVACKDTQDNVTYVENTTCNDLIIATPYFVYNAKNKIMVWTIEKLSSSELAMTYFLYLENSGGLVGSDDEADAGTYKTNEYAYLTYTNHLQTECKQEFPEPQITWNGAQVTYVFYLVNEQGQPVNRAGRVVPFSEAVYVTDTFTYSMIWNDLERSEAMDAEVLAAEKLPAVYQLYDTTASYSIHVYEDETGSNLNNHFLIEGSQAVNTTYVFNAKSDSTKYTVPGYYAATSDYKCKSAYLTPIYDADGEITGFDMPDDVKASAVTFAADPGADYFFGGYAYYSEENEGVTKYYTIVQNSGAKPVESGFDFANTTVAFAVVWKPRLETDTVVIDFGLDVNIDVAMNDALSGSVTGVMTTAPSVAINQGVYSNAVGSTMVDVYVTIDNASVKIGTATVINNTTVNFSLDKDTGMQLNQSAIFYYESEVSYYKDSNTSTLYTEMMYSSVIVIPATTVYYEDEYVDLKTYSADGALIKNGWDVDSVSASAIQATDRPGVDKIGAAYDADNAYGYDQAYDSMSMFSMGNAASITVTSNKRGEAYFTFYGTGFDVISTTTSTTGTLIVQVFAGDEASGTAVKSLIVDTYYGMNKDGSISENNPDSIYQVPVMKVSGLTYGQYTVKIVAGYNEYFDHTSDDNRDYTLYLDAIRIYDPVDPTFVLGKDAETNGNDVYANTIYAEDGEGWPSYQELRNNVIAASNYVEDADGTVSGDNLTGAIFIDCNDANTSIADYVSYGPNNELYLAKNQAIAFNVDTYHWVNITAFEDGVTYYTMNSDGTYQKVTGEYSAETEYYLPVADVQLGIKLGNGDSATYTISAVDTTGKVVKTERITINSATDMYYSILEYAQAGTVVIQCDSSNAGILSLTNIKVTYTQAPSTQVSTTSLMWMDAESVGYSLRMLRSAPVVEEEIPEETVPETTVPEETEPETTVPEETEPETTAPEETEPETTVPEETEPETTVPEETVPEETVPQVFVPGKLNVKLSATSVKVGNSVIVTVTTGSDVEALMVNGQAVTRYTENRWTGNRTWIVKVSAEAVGTMAIEVVAYDAAGLASAPVTNTVTVTEKANNILEAIFGWLFR